MPIQFKFKNILLILVFLILHASSSFADDDPVYIYLPGMEEYSKTCESICYQHAWNQCGSRARNCSLSMPPWGQPDFLPTCSMEERTHAISCMKWHQENCQHTEVACRSKPAEPSAVVKAFIQACKDLATWGAGAIAVKECLNYRGRVRSACLAVGAVAAVGSSYVRDICGPYWYQ